MGVVVVLGWLISAVVGALIGLPRGKPGKGALLGFFLGPLGWIFMIFDAGILAIFSTFVIIILAAVWFVFTMVGESEARGQQEGSERLSQQWAAEAREREARANPSPTPHDEPSPASEPEVDPVATPTPKAGLPSVTWSAFPPGVNTPEERRAYLQRLVEEKRERAGEP